MDKWIENTYRDILELSDLDKQKKVGQVMTLITYLVMLKLYVNFLMIIILIFLQMNLKNQDCLTNQ